MKFKWSFKRLKKTASLGAFIDFDWWDKPYVFAIDVHLIFWYTAVEVYFD